MHTREPDSSFFRVVQGHLADNYAGRLLALILCELGRLEPEVFCVLLERIWGRSLSHDIFRSIAGGKAQFAREYRFVSNRSADVALILDGEPVMLIEIKEEDVDAPGNAAQHTDYLRWVDRESRSASRVHPALFLHLSRYHARRMLPLSRKNSEHIRAAYYQDLHAVLAEYRGRRDFPLSQMIVDYLEDIGVASYRTIDLKRSRKALTFLAIQMMGFNQFNGLGRLSSGETTTASVPLLEVLLNNATVFGEWLRNANGPLFSQRPLSRFKTSIGCWEDDLRRTIERHDEPDEAVTVPDDKIHEGFLYVYSALKVGGPMRSPTRGWMYVTVGFVVGLERYSKKGAGVALFGEIASDQYRDSWEETDWLREFPSEGEALRKLAQCLRGARRMALKKASGAHSKAIASLNIPQIARVGA